MHVDVRRRLDRLCGFGDGDGRPAETEDARALGCGTGSRDEDARRVGRELELRAPAEGDPRSSPRAAAAIARLGEAVRPESRPGP